VFESPSDTRSRNFGLIILLYVVREFCQSALRSDYWTSIDLRAALEDITADDLESFVEQFYNGMFVEGLVEGNLPLEVSSSSSFIMACLLKNLWKAT